MNRSAKIFIVAAVLTLLGQGVADAFEFFEMTPIYCSVPTDCHEGSGLNDLAIYDDRDRECNG